MKGPWLAVAAVVLGAVGCVAPFLPFDLTGVRQFAAWPFGLVGLALGVVGCVGPRRAKPLAVVGAVLSGLALTIGTVFVVASVLP